MAASNCLSGNCVWSCAKSAGDSVRLSALNELAILRRAQQHANGWVFVSLAHIAVEGFEVEIELAQVLGFETVHLELDGNQTVQAAVKEQQVEGEITSTDLYRELRADEAKITAQLDQEGAQLAQQAL